MTISNTAKKPVLLIIGAGAGIGMHVARRFVAGGYHACLCRRSDQEALDRAVEELEGTGFLMDATTPNALENLVNQVETQVGPVSCAVYNLGAQIGNRGLEQTTLKQFEMGWKLGTFGLFRLSQALLPRMAERQSGSLIVTSSTAAVRGNHGQHSHAAAMGGRRMLCQSLNDEYAKEGVHVSHLLIDGAVDAPDTLGKMIGLENIDKLRQIPHRLMKPEAIAETYWYLAHQDPSAQTFELDLRSKLDTPWWNSPSSKL